MKLCLIAGLHVLISLSFHSFSHAIRGQRYNEYPSAKCSYQSWPASHRVGLNYIGPLRLDQVYRCTMVVLYITCEQIGCVQLKQVCSIDCINCAYFEEYNDTIFMDATFLPSGDRALIKYTVVPNSDYDSDAYYADFEITGEVRPPATVRLTTTVMKIMIPMYMTASIEAGYPHPANCRCQLDSKVKETFYLQGTARARVLMKDVYGNIIDGKTAPKRNYAERFSAMIIRNPGDTTPMYSQTFRMSCPGACDGWLVIEWTPTAYQGGQYLWIGVDTVKSGPIGAPLTRQLGKKFVPIQGSPLFFSVVSGATPYSGASPRCSVIQWPASGRQGNIPYINMMVGVKYRVQVGARFFACEGPECSGKTCSATCPPCQIYKGYPGTFALRGEYSNNKSPVKFGDSWVPSNYSESPQSKGMYIIDFSLTGDVKPPVTIKLFTLIGGGQNSNYMLANVQAGSADPRHTWGQWASEGKERVDLKSMAKFRVMMKDSYGNDINAKTAPDREYSKVFVVKILRNPQDSQPMYAETFKITCNGQCNGRVCARGCDGWLMIEWTPMTHVGRQWLWIGIRVPSPTAIWSPNVNGLLPTVTQPIQGSPFMFTVLPATDVSRCVGSWRKDHLKEPNSFEVGKEIIFDISKKNSDDKFLATWIYPFTIKVLDADTKLPINVGMKASQVTELAVMQSVQFTMQKTGNFLLQVSGRQVPGRWTEFIIGSPFSFRMLPGPVDIKSCSISLKGRNALTAGEKVVFELVLKDSYGNNVSLNPGTNQTLVDNLKLKLVQPGKLFKVPISLDPKFVPMSDMARGVITIEGYPKVAGKVSFEAYLNDTSIRGTPQPLIVRSGPPSATTSSCKWKYNESTFEAGTSADVEVLYVDEYYNAVNSNFIFQTSFLSYRGVYIAPLAVDLSRIQLVPELITLTFSPTKVGFFFVQIGTKNQNITDSPLDYMVSSAPVLTKACIPQWQNGNVPVQAGKNATLRVWMMDSFGNNVTQRTFLHDDPAIFMVDVMEVGSLGNTSTVKNFQLVSKLNMTDGYQEFYLSITKVGQYKIDVNDKNSSILGSPISLEVIPGNVAVYNCLALWDSGKFIFRSGDIATIHVMLKDDFNNSLSPFSNMVNFSVMNVRRKGDNDVLSEFNLSFKVQDAQDYKVITFLTNIAGVFHLQLGTQEMNISNSPLTFTVFPGAFNFKKSSGKWLDGVNTFDVGGTASLLFTPMDSSNNFVSIKFEDLQTLGISITAIHNATRFQISLLDLYLNPPVGDSISQILTFSVGEPGAFLLRISKGGDSLLGSPFLFQCTQGAVDRNKSSIFGIGLHDSIAGNTSIFYIQLRDYKGYPTGSTRYSPQISIARFPNYDEVNKSVIYYPEKIGLYQVTYTAVISGTYFITCTWKGITLNRDGAIQKTVHAGPLYLPNTHVSGSGLEGGTACSWLTLTILTFDYYNNTYQGEVNVTLRGAVDFSMDYNVSTGIGRTNVTYNIRQSQTNPYSISMFTYYNDDEALIPPSPFQVQIVPGSLAVSASTGAWENDTNIYEVGVMAKFVITQRDMCGNIVPMTRNAAMNSFQVFIYKNGQSMPHEIKGLKIVPLGSTHQRVKFQISQPGEYVLQIGGRSEMTVGSNTEMILGSPFHFTYITGVPNAKKSIIVGSGLENSTAGEFSTFFIQCRDRHGNAVATFPSSVLITMGSDRETVEVNVVSVLGYSGLLNVSYQAFVAGEYRINITFLTASVNAKSSFRKFVFPGRASLPNCVAVGQGLQGGIAGASIEFNIFSYDKYGNMNPSGLLTYNVALVPNFTISTFITSNNTGIFLVRYVIPVARVYSMYILAQLEDTQDSIQGSPYKLTILPGPVDMKKSRVGGVGISPLASVKVPNPVAVLLKDSYGNPTPGLLSRLNMNLITSFNADITNFTYNKINGYVATYTPKSEGVFTIIVTYKNINFVGVPFKVWIQSGTKKFPQELTTRIQHNHMLVDSSINREQAEAFAVFFRNMTTNRISMQRSEVFTAGQMIFVYIMATNFTPTYDLKVSISLDPSPWLTVSEVQAVKVNNFTYLANMTITVVGTFKVYVSLYRNIIKVGDTISVRTGKVYIPSCVAIGQGLTKGSVGVAEDITIQTQDMFGNLVQDSTLHSFVLQLQRGSFYQYFYASQSSAFRYKGSFVVFAQGQYNLSITVGDVSIYGSPFKVEISEGLWSRPTISLLSPLLVAIEKQPFSFRRGVGDDLMTIKASNAQGLGEKKKLPIYIRSTNHAPSIIAPDYVDAGILSTKQVNISLHDVVVADADEFNVQEDITLQLSITITVDTSGSDGDARGGRVCVRIPGSVAITASFRSEISSQDWEAVPAMVPPDASWELVGTAIRFRASVHDCNTALSTLHYIPSAPIHPGVADIANVTIVANDMGNFGCFNDCSTAESVPLIAIATIIITNDKLHSQKLKMLRPDILVGLTTSIGTLLIIMSGICACIFLVNKLIVARGNPEMRLLLVDFLKTIFGSSSVPSMWRKDPDSSTQDLISKDFIPKLEKEDAQEVTHCEFKDASDKLLEQSIHDEDEHLTKGYSEFHRVEDMLEARVNAEDMVERMDSRPIHHDRAASMSSMVIGPQDMCAHAQPDDFSDPNDCFHETVNDENIMDNPYRQTNSMDGAFNYEDVSGFDVPERLEYKPVNNFDGDSNYESIPRYAQAMDSFQGLEFSQSNSLHGAIDDEDLASYTEGMDSPESFENA